MKKFIVTKYPEPKTLARCVEVAEDYNGEVPQGSELMTLAEFDAWKALPEQATFIAELEAQLAIPYVPVPESVTRRQLKEWLIRNNKLAQVEQVLDNIEDVTEKAIAHNYWTESNDFERAHPLIASIGGAIGMTSEEIDAAFIAAKEL